MTFWLGEKPLHYTQKEAGEKLGVNRSTIQNWERRFTRVPGLVELACEELLRKWKQNAGFGPVALVYTSEPMRPTPNSPAHEIFAQCERYRNNEMAIRAALRLIVGSLPGRGRSSSAASGPSATARSMQLDRLVMHAKSLPHPKERRILAITEQHLDPSQRD